MNGYRGARRWVVPLLWLMTACGSASVSSPPNAHAGRQTEAASAQGPSQKSGQLAFSVVATGPTEDVAYAQATRQLLTALLADESLLASDALSDHAVRAVHDRASDPCEVTKAGGGFQVKIGLHTESLRAALARIDAALITVPAPTASHDLAPVVHAARLGHWRRALCQRQKKLVSAAPCDSVDTSSVDQQLAALVARVALRCTYPDGIPNRDGVWLRPITVEAVIDQDGGTRSMPDLPLRIQRDQSAEAVSAETAANGVATLPIPRDVPASATWTVTLDADRAFGPLARLVPPVSTSIRARATSLARSTVVYVRGRQVPEAAQALSQSLGGHAALPVQLAAPDARLLSEASVEKMKGAAPALADRLRGALDTILVLDAESEFASRMGTQRVWYEARGTLRAFDAWTGALLADVTASVTESGLGESRAESAAREALGRQLAHNLELRLRASSPGH